MPKRLQTVNFGLYPINKKTPKITSKTTTKMAIPNAKGSKTGILSTSELKYSSSLYENPKGSFNFINPEKMNNAPTKNRLMFIIYFI